jgi:mono/diheme cytochrome c family protein
VPLAGALAACREGAADPSGPDAKVTTEARALGIHTRALPSDARAQARRALESDAKRREARFQDAAEPGFLFRTTRLSERELAEGRRSQDEIFQIGAQLFHLPFSPELGLGTGKAKRPSRFKAGDAPGYLAARCADCHWRGGPGGAGDTADVVYAGGDGDTQASASARQPPALAGAGWVEIAAREATGELAALRERAIREAKAAGQAVSVDLVAKGVSFGRLVAEPSGGVDTRLVVGVAPDLVVRPFGAKGAAASLRDAVEEELRAHLGLLTTHLAEHGDPARIGGPNGPDPDGDGVTDEITEGQLLALTLYVGMQEVPTITRAAELVVPGLASDLIPRERVAGEQTFARIGCASCHVPELRVTRATLSVESRLGRAPVSVDLAKDGAEPRLAPREDGTFAVPLFADLRRHDMGPGLADPRASGGVSASTFMTRPLWGIARSRPYLHDGRAPTLHDAIMLHGGEALEARDAYVRLGDVERAELTGFLNALTRARRYVGP